MKQRTPMRARKIEGVAVSHERDFLFRNSRAGKSLDHVALDSPCHGANEAFQRWRANEAFQRWRRICGADFQDLRDQCRIMGNPVSHDNPTSGVGSRAPSPWRHRTASARIWLQRCSRRDQSCGLPTRVNRSHRLLKLSESGNMAHALIGPVMTLTGLSSDFCGRSLKLAEGA